MITATSLETIAPMNTLLRILLVDDDKTDYVLTRDILASEACGKNQLEWASDFESGLAAAGQERFDVILLDYMLGRRTGVEFLQCLRANGVATPVIMLTAVEEQPVDEEALAAGASDYLTKAILTAPLLRRAIRYTLEKHRLHEQLAQSHDDLRSILDELRAGTAITDAEGRRLTFVSRSFEDMLGRPRDEVLGLPWQEACPLGEADRAAVERVLSQPPAQREKIPVRWETPAGTSLWMELEIKDDPRNPDRKILVLYDVTDLRGLRRMLDQQACFRDLVGKSSAMRAVYRQIQEFAQYDVTILIEGETGTGKELVARAIHDSGKRADRPFIAVNCAGLTESLLSSQLFGHRRGAFSGAVDDHVGFFEAAHGGTLFLDEVGIIPISVQTSLLRVLQEREIVRVGDASPRPIDVQILAASNRDLDLAVEEGTVRQDFLYRIRVARIGLPALRARREDIPLLSATFLRQFRARTGKDVAQIEPEAVSLLLDYHWPGNVRELQNTMETAAIRSTGGSIGPEHLPPEVVRGTPEPITENYVLRERQRILGALEATGGNRAQAARILGISRTTLYRRMTELELDTASNLP